jgi:hypothetical protein
MADFDELFASYMETLTSESDRGCALVGAAHIDHALRKLLQLKLNSVNKNDLDKLFAGPAAPLGTLSSRTLLAAGLALINNDQRCAIDCIRKIRNEFAHSVGAIPIPTSLLDLALRHTRALLGETDGDFDSILKHCESPRDKLLVVLSFQWAKIDASTEGYAAGLADGKRTQSLSGE